MTSAQKVYDHPRGHRLKPSPNAEILRAITPNKPTTAPTTTQMDYVFVQVSRGLKWRVSGPETFTFLLRLFTTHIDSVDTGGRVHLHNFGVCTGTDVCYFSREVHVLVSAVTGSKRDLAPGVDVVLELVRVAVNETVPTFMLTLYSGSMDTDLKPYASLEAM